MSQPGRLGSLLESLRCVAGTGLSIIQTRLELIGVEVEAELCRARALQVQSYAVLLLGLFATGFAGCALIVTFWDSHRVLVSWLVAGSFVALSLVALAILTRARRARPQPFAATLRQLEQDIAMLRGRP